MKIAILSFHFAEYALSLASSLSSENSVLLFLQEQNKILELGNKAYKNIKNLKIWLIPERGPANPLIMLNIYRIIKEIKTFCPDVIHCQETLNDYFIFSLPFLSRYPRVLTIHDHIKHEGADSKRRFIRKRINIYERYLRRIPEAVIVHSETIKNETEKLLPWVKDQVVAIHHGPLGIKPLYSDKNDKQADSVLFFGRIEKYKGLKYLVEAIKILKDQNFKVRVTIAGTGSDLQIYKEKILKDNSFALIEKYFTREEVKELFEKSSIIVLPYTSATQSGVAALAINYGCAVVASNVGGIKEFVRNNYNGMIIPPNNSEKLAEAIKKLIENPVLAKEMGQNGQKLAKSEFSWEEIASQTKIMYRLAIKRKSRLQI